MKIMKCKSKEGLNGLVLQFHLIHFPLFPEHISLAKKKTATIPIGNNKDAKEVPMATL